METLYVNIKELIKSEVKKKKKKTDTKNPGKLNMLFVCALSQPEFHDLFLVVIISSKRLVISK